MATAEELKAGQMVLAFGSPLGLQNSVSLGIVSAVARQLEPESPMVYIQTDASINPGNSGGPLVDARGRLIGINTLILSGGVATAGPGFAAPSNIVRNVYEQIRKSGYVLRGEIGIRPQTITPTLAAGLGLKRDHGVVLADVKPTGPARPLYSKRRGHPAQGGETDQCIADASRRQCVRAEPGRFGAPQLSQAPPFHGSASIVSPPQRVMRAS